MSKKESEFERYDRVKKLQREAEANKKRFNGDGERKKGRPKMSSNNKSKHRLKSYMLDDEEDYYEYYK